MIERPWGRVVGTIIMVLCVSCDIICLSCDVSFVFLIHTFLMTNMQWSDLMKCWYYLSIHSLFCSFTILFIHSSTCTMYLSIHHPLISHPYIYSSLHTYIYLSINSSTHQSVHWFIHLSIRSVNCHCSGIHLKSRQQRLSQPHRNYNQK